MKIKPKGIYGTAHLHSAEQISQRYLSEVFLHSFSFNGSIKYLRNSKDSVFAEGNFAIAISVHWKRRRNEISFVFVLFVCFFSFFFLYINFLSSLPNNSFNFNLKRTIIKTKHRYLWLMSIFTASARYNRARGFLLRSVEAMWKKSAGAFLRL